MNNYYDIFKGYKITGKYGENRSYYKKGRTHQGVDLAYPMGSALPSMISGEVIRVGNDPKGYGNFIDVYNPELGIKVRYGHAKDFMTKQGDKVIAGQVLGSSGSTGRSTGPHLHVQTWKNGILTNPQEIYNMLNNGTQQAIQQYAKQVALPQQQESPLKQKLIDELVKTVFTPVEQPRFTSLADVFDSEKGNKLNTFGQYLGSPQATRLLGSFLGGTYLDTNGNPVYSGEAEAQRQEALMNEAQDRAAKQELARQGAVQNLYAGELQNQLDYDKLKQTLEIANAKMLADSNEKALDRQFKEAQLAETKQYHKDMVNLQKENAVAKQNEKIEKKQAKEQEKLDNAQKTNDQIDVLMKYYKQLPQSKATPGTMKAKAVWTGAVNKFGVRNSDVAAFEGIRNPLVTQLARTIAGEKGVLTDNDFKRAEKMLPTAFDSPAQAYAKIKSVKELVKTNTPQTSKSTKVGKYEVTVK